MSALTPSITEFLDDLRESGECNVFAAGPYLQEAFGLSRADARAAVLEWAKFQSKEKTNEVQRR